MNKHERTYSQIRERIVEGFYRPGHRLVLDALAREFGVSPVPVREALRRLEAEGWVIYKPNVGAQVAPVDEARWEAEMRVLAVLEGHATALAADHLRPDDFRELHRINTEMEAARQDPVGFSRLNRRWHFIIYERCPNTYLLELIGETNERLDAIRRTVFTYVPDREDESVGEHAGILDLLERGADFEAIESAARAHKQRTVEAFLVHQHAAMSQGESLQ